MSQNSYNTASGDTSLREEIGLGGKFKGVTKFTQYSTASVQQLGDKQAERRPMREELGSRFARTSSCRHLVQFLAKFDQKCLLTDSLHRLGSRLARTSSVSLEMTLLLCATKSINSQNLHIIEKMLHSSYSVFDYLSESLRTERAFDQLPEGLTTLPKAQYGKYFDLFPKQNPL